MYTISSPCEPSGVTAQVSSKVKCSASEDTDKPKNSLGLSLCTLNKVMYFNIRPKGWQKNNTMKSAPKEGANKAAYSKSYTCPK